MRFKMASFTRSKDSATDGSNGNVHVGAVILQPWNSWSDHGMRGLWDCIQQKISKGLGDVYRNFVICHLKKISPVYIWLINRLMCSSSYMEWWLDDPSCFFFYGWIGHQLLPLHPSAWIEKIGFLAACLCLSFAFGAFSAVSMIESFRPIFLKKCKSCPMIWRSRDHVGFIKFVWHFWTGTSTHWMWYFLVQTAPGNALWGNTSGEAGLPLALDASYLGAFLPCWDDAGCDSRDGQMAV